MQQTTHEAQVRSGALKTMGGLALCIISFGLWICVFYQILFSFFDSVDWLPLAVNIVIDVLAVALTPLAIWTLVTGARSVVTTLDEAEIEGLASVVGDLPEATEPADVRVVGDALLHLNTLDLPYSVDVEHQGDVSVVTVQWRSEELHWRTLLSRGSMVRRWRMVLRLDTQTGTYTFIERSSAAQLVGSGASATLSGSRSWSRGKTMGAIGLTKVWAAGQVWDPDGTGAGGTVRITPSDAKVPVFRIVRGHGWRAKRENVVSRIWEF